MALGSCTTICLQCNASHLRLCTVALQYHFLEFDQPDYTQAERKALRQRYNKMQLLMIDSRPGALFQKWPPNWHYLPYSTNFHYVPQADSRNAVIAGPLYKAPHFDAPTAAVRPCFWEAQYNLHQGC